MQNKCLSMFVIPKTLFKSSRPWQQPDFHACQNKIAFINLQYFICIQHFWTKLGWVFLSECWMKVSWEKPQLYVNCEISKGYFFQFTSSIVGIWRRIGTGRPQRLTPESSTESESVGPRCCWSNKCSSIRRVQLRTRPAKIEKKICKILLYQEIQRIIIVVLLQMKTTLCDIFLSYLALMKK